MANGGVEALEPPAKCLVSELIELYDTSLDNGVNRLGSARCLDLFSDVGVTSGDAAIGERDGFAGRNPIKRVGLFGVKDGSGRNGAVVATDSTEVDWAEFNLRTAKSD